MMIRRVSNGLIALIVGVAAGGLTDQASGQNLSCAQAKQLAQQYLNQIDRYCAPYAYNPSLKRQCEQRIRDAIAQVLKQACNQKPPTTPNPPTQPQCNKNFCGEARARGQGILRSFQRLRNRNAYVYHISFSYRPTYQGQCKWVPSRNGYSNVSAWRFQRVISSLMNRCNLVTRVRYSRRRR